VASGAWWLRGVLGALTVAVVVLVAVLVMVR
jgi:hypothetical protein